MIIVVARLLVTVACSAHTDIAGRAGVIAGAAIASATPVFPAGLLSRFSHCPDPTEEVFGKRADGAVLTEVLQAMYPYGYDRKTREVVWRGSDAKPHELRTLRNPSDRIFILKPAGGM